jgi:hypothetical protein
MCRERTWYTRAVLRARFWTAIVYGFQTFIFQFPPGVLAEDIQVFFFNFLDLNPRGGNATSIIVHLIKTFTFAEIGNHCVVKAHAVNFAFNLFIKTCLIVSDGPILVESIHINHIMDSTASETIFLAQLIMIGGASLLAGRDTTSTVWFFLGI